VLRSLKPTVVINGIPASQIQGELELAQAQVPFDEWRKKVATLPPQKQVRAVAGRLRLDNPARVDQEKIEGGGVVTSIRIVGSKVSDLRPVQALTGLKSLDCNATSVSDLSRLKGMPLTRLVCSMKVTDLSPLKEMSLQELSCDFKAERDADILRSIKTLKTINGQPAAEVLK
jgi:hypothetical protein